MKLKKIIASCLSISLLLTAAPAKAMAAPSVALESITWQDPENAVLSWKHFSGYTYEIYRADTSSGSYALIGTSNCGSYRDDTAVHPNKYYYKILPVDGSGKKGAFSAPMQTGTNPQPVDSVFVIMYHDFITEADQQNGVVFGEYALSPEDFEADLKYLKNNGYTTITSDDLAEYLHKNKPLPAKAVIISIDDGTHGVYTNAWPLLKKYNMKADFNLIGENIDATWENLYTGGSRKGQEAPYCTWEELIEMHKSGNINLCSHSYGLHRYNRDGRIGAAMIDGESADDFAAVIRADYKKVSSSLTGWTDIIPRTLAYPYSKRSAEGDKVILENTTFEILMAGQGARGTEGNYFVRGTDFSSQLTLMSRPCRMEGTPISVYLDNITRKDGQNGVNTEKNHLTLSAAECKSIASAYQPFSDVKGTAWYAGSVYYSLLNGIMLGTSATAFSPDTNINRGMAATLLHRMAGTPASSKAPFSDTPVNQWYTAPALWAHENNIIPASGNKFRPNDTITREQLAMALYQYAGWLGLDRSAVADLNRFTDAERISTDATVAMAWAVAQGIFGGNADGTLQPQGNVTRAQMTTILMNWNQKIAN